MLKLMKTTRMKVFEAILFDSNVLHITPTGDGEILLQYEDFNNTSNGSYGGGTPLHGGYCSIGIEDHWGTTGLEYTFNNTYDRAAMPLSDETALFISTRKTAVWNLPQAQLELSNNELNVEVEENQVVTNYLTLTNSGEEESILSYNINTSPLAVSAGNDDFGNHWIDSDLDLILIIHGLRLNKAKIIELFFKIMMMVKLLKLGLILITMGKIIVS